MTIAGGGLAGLALAGGLRGRGVKVTVHEAGHYPRHRVCGEFISGVSQETLEAIGMADSLADAKRHQSLVWYRKGKRILDSELPDPAIAISRHRLDDRLQHWVKELGGEVVEGSRLPREANEGFVWAAGRKPQRGDWVGLKCHLLDYEMKEGLEMHLGDNGYLGLTPIEDGRVNACGLFQVDRSRSAKGSELLVEYLRAGGNDELADRLLETARDEESFLGVAGFQLGWQDGDGMCTVGDALGMIPPFTGNGMSMALQSAELAMAPLTRWSEGSLDWAGVMADIQRLSRQRFGRRLKAAHTLHRVLLNSKGQGLLENLGRHGLLPFRPLLSLVR